MALIKKVRDKTPTWGAGCWFAENATLVGDLLLGENCTIWFNAVLRGDVHEIRIGNNCNVQDGAIIHCTYHKAGTYIGNNVSIAHNAVVHGCNLKDNVLIGMGAIVMDGAVVNSGAVIAAGAIILPGTIVEENSIYAGVPGKKVKDTSPGIREMIARTAKNYPMYSNWYKEDE